MTKLTRYEMETTVNYNAEEGTATLYTRDKAVMRRLDRLAAEFPETYQCIRSTDIDKTYTFPKKYLSFRKPRVLTEEQRLVMRERLAKAREGQGIDDGIADDDMFDEEDPDEMDVE